MRASVLLCLVATSCVQDVDLGRDRLALRIACGATMTCGEDAEGDVLCFGLDAQGQLADELDPGHATTEDCALGVCTSTPHDANLFVISDLALSRDWGCVIIGDGTRCFGNARYGQLGYGIRDDEPHPIPEYISLFNAPIDVVLGEAHGCVRYADQRVYCWGFGGHGQLGVDPGSLDDCGTANAEDAARLGIEVGATIRCATEPIPVPAILDATAIFAGGHGTCVTRGTGEVRCMGRNDDGQLGLAPSADLTAPTIAPFGTEAVLALGLHHGCALEDGQVSCFGRNDLGQLGRGAACTEGCARAPVALGAPVQVDVGRDVTWVLDRYGTLHAFGDAREGALGRAGNDDCAGIACARSPRPVRLSHPVFAFDGGEAHVCAVLTDLTTECFGRGTEGQTGDAFHTSGPEAHDVPGLHPVPRIN